MDKDKAIAMLEKIAEYTEADVKHYEGQDFNGRNVAEYFGKQAAAIVTITEILTTVIKEGIDGRTFKEITESNQQNY